jgi:hypothetical protein
MVVDGLGCIGRLSIEKIVVAFDGEGFEKLSLHRMRRKPTFFVGQEPPCHR